MMSLDEKPSNQSNIMSIKFIKLLKLFTLYRLLTISRITRLFKNNKLFEYLVSKISVSSDVQIGIASISRIIFMIHLIGSTWIIIGELNTIEEEQNWLRATFIIDSDKLM